MRMLFGRLNTREVRVLPRCQAQLVLLSQASLMVVQRLCGETSCLVLQLARQSEVWNEMDVGSWEIVDETSQKLG